LSSWAERGDFTAKHYQKLHRDEVRRAGNLLENGARDAFPQFRIFPQATGLAAKVREKGEKDVWHHLKTPLPALDEADRGRVDI
jgi:hypothetical protein